jgi:tetratricopeptide (TPR) repeat protein
MRHPVSRQQALIERTWRFKNYVFAEYLLEQSYQYLAQDPARAEDLARLALVIAEKLEGSHYGPALINDLKARAFAYLGNAQRVSMDLDEADQSLTQAEKNLQDGSGDPLLQARLLSFLGSLRREQRRFDESEECLEKAESIYREAGEDHWLGHTLVTHAKLHYDAGDVEKAIGLYEKALDLIDQKADPRLEFCLLMGLAGAHQEQSDYDQASKLLAKANKLAEAQSNALDALRLRWIQGKVAYGQGKLEQAESSFDAVRSDFMDRDLDYEAALVSLDTAQVYAQQGRTAEMKQLAEAMLPIFRSRNIHREATAALLVFQKAALAEKASLKMVQEIASYLREARDNPQLRYKQAS